VQLPEKNLDPDTTRKGLNEKSRMSTYTQILYQIVFSTKNRERCLVKEHREELFKYIWGLLKNKKCHLYRINGVDDHIHILMQLHPSQSLAALIKDIKISSTLYIKEKALFKNFTSWQEGYGAFTYGIKDKDKLIEYIKNQEAHHTKKTFKEEYLELLQEHGIEYNEQYLF
jgi:REP element-mobilizing transposase RayT